MGFARGRRPVARGLDQVRRSESRREMQSATTAPATRSASLGSAGPGPPRPHAGAGHPRYPSTPSGGATGRGRGGGVDTGAGFAGALAPLPGATSLGLRQVQCARRPCGRPRGRGEEHCGRNGMRLGLGRAARQPAPSAPLQPACDLRGHRVRVGGGGRPSVQQPQPSRNAPLRAPSGCTPPRRAALALPRAAATARRPWLRPLLAQM